MLLRFTKMHGAGNDFVIVDRRAKPAGADDIAAATCRRLGDRHTGIGFDQMLVIGASDDADAQVRIFNADGSEAAQCGNGLRCVARYLSEVSGGRGRWRLDGLAGPCEARVDDDGLVSVSMGRPDWSTDAAGCLQTSPVTLAGEEIAFTPVSLGNPHAVVAVADVAGAAVEDIGTAMQAVFANGVNVGFMQQTGPDTLRLRVFERGVGETRACGSGACAAAVVAMRGRPETREFAVSLPGGQLMVRWAGENETVWLRGPAQRVFEGRVEI